MARTESTLPPIEEGFYTPSPDPKGRRRYGRYVLGVMGGMVRYNKGGSRHFCCRTATFMRWMKRYGVQRSHASVAPPLILDGE